MFDFKLHFNFHEAAVGNEAYDMRKIFDGTLVQADRFLAVTFVENHDTQPGQAFGANAIPGVCVRAGSSRARTCGCVHERAHAGTVCAAHFTFTLKQVANTGAFQYPLRSPVWRYLYLISTQHVFSPLRCSQTTSRRWGTRSSCCGLKATRASFTPTTTARSTRRRSRSTRCATLSLSGPLGLYISLIKPGASSTEDVVCHKRVCDDLAHNANSTVENTSLVFLCSGARAVDKW